MVLKRSIAKESLILVVVIFLGNLIAMSFAWYALLWWFDMPMHFMGGVFLGYLTTLLFYKTFYIQEHISPSRIIFLGTLIVGIVGGGWEIFEYVVQHYTGAILANPMDSYSDLCFDVAGGLSALLLLYRRRTPKNEIARV